MHKQRHVRAQEVGAKETEPVLISLILFVPNQDRFYQSPMETDRARYNLRVNLDGTEKSFEK